MVTGARQNELLQARRESIDHERRQMTIVGKRNKQRVIDLEPFGAYELLSRLPAYAGKPWLFWHGAGESYKQSGFPGNFRRTVRKVAALAKKHGAPFRPFRFHDLRHWHAVQWLKDGRSIYDLQHRLGHTSIKTTEMYSEYLTPEEQRTVKERTGTKTATKAAARAQDNMAEGA